ncbi:MAG: hypothetical protein PHI18_00175 [bacterium]|nr:hypothetical protein [bacterium]
MAKLILVANSSRNDYRRGTDASGQALTHQPGRNYYEIAEEPLTKPERKAAAGLEGFRGELVTREMVARFNRPVTPLMADVVEKELAVEQKKSDPPQTPPNEDSVLFENWMKLPYEQVQKVGSENGLQVVSVKKETIVRGLMDKQIAIPQSE